jgi:elongation factor P
VVNYQHVKPGKGPAYYRTTLKNIKDETIVEKSFRSDDKISQAFLEEKRLTYLYKDNKIYYFMDQESFEQIPLNKDKIKNIVDYLTENAEVKASLVNDQIIEIKLPTFIELKVEETFPGVKGNTAKNTTTKKATLETGAKIEVPIFVEIGDKIRIDTRSKRYVGKSR